MIMDSDAEKKQLEMNKFMIAKYNIDTGLLSPVEMKKIEDDSIKKAYENLVYSDPKLAASLIQKEERLKQEDKHELTRKSKQVQKQEQEYADWQQKQTQIQGSLQLSQALQGGTINPTMVRNMQQQGIIDAETAAIFDSIALGTKYDVPESTQLGEPDYFIRLIEDSMGDKKKIDKVLKDAAEAYGNNKIGTNQYRYLLQTAQETFERQAQGIYTKSKKQNGIMAAIDGLKSLFGKGKENELSQAVNSLVERSGQDDNPVEVSQQIINEHRVSLKPEISTFPAEGKIMVDKNGNRARVFPDGRVEALE
jgi:hypothetical protein